MGKLQQSHQSQNAQPPQINPTKKKRDYARQNSQKVDDPGKTEYVGHPFGKRPFMLSIWGGGARPYAQTIFKGEDCNRDEFDNREYCFILNVKSIDSLQAHRNYI